MKILFLTDNFPPEVNAPATRTYEHCKKWVEIGAKVTVITCFPNFPKGKIYKGYKNKLIQKEVVDGIKVIRVWTFITANEGFVKRTLDYISFSVSAFLAGLFQKADVIVATSPQFFTALAGRTLSFWKRTPWVMEVRDLWPESVKTVGAMEDNMFIRYFEKEELWCYKSASKIITVTDSFKKHIIQKGIPENKIGVVKNGVNSKEFYPVPKDKLLIKQLGLEGKIILGYVGTHGMAHKLDFLLDCAKSLEETKYHFLFLGDGAEKKKLQMKVNNEGIKNVSMLDSVAKSEVCKYLSILDVSVINLKKSALFKTVIPSKIFENAAMEIPILLGVDGESRQILGKYNAGLYYEPENQLDFITKLDAITKPEVRNIFQAGGRQLAKDFNRDKLAMMMFDELTVFKGDKPLLEN